MIKASSAILMTYSNEHSVLHKYIHYFSLLTSLVCFQFSLLGLAAALYLAWRVHFVIPTPFK